MIINNLDISDGVNYITEEITFRSTPNRTVNSVGISRRPGDKLTAIEWSNKEIEIKGYVLGSSPSNLRTLVDTLQQNFAVKSLSLSVDTDRSYTANLTKLDIPTQFFNNTLVNYGATFLSVDPFAYASAVTASGTVVSGTSSYTGAVTISGTVFAEPLLTLTPKGANVGNSGITAIKVTHIPSGETMTVSGMFNYASPVVIDYNNFLVTNSGVNSDYTGIFSRWEPGLNQFTLQVTAGATNGFNYKFGYQPRYYQ
jgi:phage-related protein